MTTYSIDLDPDSGQKVYMKLFRNVTNIEQLRSKLLNGQLKCCLIKPNLICDPLQVVIAANKAVTAGGLTTKSIYTEILFNLSISKNITQSLKMFGTGENDINVLVVTVDKLGEESCSEVAKNLEGEEVDISFLSEMSDIKTIKKTYKINDIEYQATPLLTSVVSRIATKDFISH